MNYSKSTLLSVCICYTLTACAQKNNDKAPTESTPKTSTESSEMTKLKERHRYGGWYCPDNFGFAPMNIQDLDQTPVVADRLPTEEETRSGKSLMFVDSEKFPDARPLDIGLPRIGRVYTQHSNMKELVVVIQAIVVQEDTVLGYRFPNGGNGSAWWSDVELLETDEVDAIGSTPYVYKKIEVEATTEDIWASFSETFYARQLAEKFKENVFLNSQWTEDTRAKFKFESGDDRGIGMVMNMYGNLYMHIDYELNGQHYAEKLLVGEDNEKGTTEVHFVAGPFRQDVEKAEEKWSTWMKSLQDGI